jgi:hypothetical protein
VSDLTRFRDHCHRMAGKSAVPASEAALWLALATEIDNYLAGPDDQQLGFEEHT